MHFEKAFKYVILNEGEQRNVVDGDRGGFTTWGITDSRAKTHRCLSHLQGLNVKTLTLEQAKHIYLSDYWLFEAVRDLKIAVKLFDFGVNFGPSTSVRLAQEALVSMGFSLKVDGILGRITAEVLNSVEPQKFLDALEIEADDRYADIVVNDYIQAHGKNAFNLRQLKFLKGWLRRSNKRYYI